MTQNPHKPRWRLIGWYCAFKAHSDELTWFHPQTSATEPTKMIKHQGWRYIYQQVTP